MRLSRLTVLMIFALLIAVNSYAELPPKYYQELQKKAPEYLKIEVVAAHTETNSSKDESIESITDVELEAKVVEVVHSKSKLKPGDMIKIKYSHTVHKPGWAGPGEVPILELGNIIPAFLGKAEGKDYYEPAARGQSFYDLLKPQETK